MLIISPKELALYAVSQRILDDTLCTLLNREQVDDNDWEDLGKNANHDQASNISPGK